MTSGQHANNSQTPADPLTLSRRFCTAPMMRYSHAAARRLWRYLAPNALLYSEMLVCDAVIHGPRQRLLDFSGQSPAALQLGGGEPNKLQLAGQIGEELGAAEININCGCPSKRVQSGGFGACLMKKPNVVANAVSALKKSVQIPITVKCRIAVDDMDADSGLLQFAKTVVDNGADAIIIHARRALLSGLNPAQNRAVPPLDYERARKLKESLGNFPVIVNGGIDNLQKISQHLNTFDGVMSGRAIANNPYWLAQAAQNVYLSKPPSRKDALQFMLNDAETRPTNEWRKIANALMGLFHGEKDARYYRRCLMLPRENAIPLLREYAKQ